MRALVRAGLAEDQAHADVTTQTLIDPSWTIQALVVAKQNGIVSGLPLAKLFFKAMDPRIQFKANVHDGAHVHPKQTLAFIKGKARSVLSGERPALNALQHLSGIATFAASQVMTLKGTSIRLLDTRKTLPGWRVLQKYAVRCGGATNHRMSLGDEVLIKENHLRIARLAGHDWISDVQRLRRKRPSMVVQLEIQTDQDLNDALVLKPQRVLLDNLTRSRTKRMIRILRHLIPGIEIELTGGITPAALPSLARLHPDRISMGRLTHSVQAFDCSLDIIHVDAS